MRFANWRNLFPNNYLYGPDDGELPEGVIRVTAIADYDRWAALSEEEYQLEKLRWYDRTSAAAVRFIAVSAAMWWQLTCLRRRQFGGSRWHR